MTDSSSDSLTNLLAGISAEDYGESYKAHILQIYQLYLEMADRISSRRERANSFFLTLNTAIVGFIGYMSGTDKVSVDEPWLSIVGFAGIAICYLWYRIIRSYRGLNSAKFKVIHEIERMLPIKPYDAEWEYVGRGKNSSLYLPFTHVEIFIPWIFLVLHVVIFLRYIPWNYLYFGVFGNAA